MTNQKLSWPDMSFDEIEKFIRDNDLFECDVWPEVCKAREAAAAEKAIQDLLYEAGPDRENALKADVYIGCIERLEAEGLLFCEASLDASLAILIQRYKLAISAPSP